MKCLIIFLLFLLVVLRIHAQSGFDARIAEAAKTLTCPAPNDRNPVSLNAQLLQEKDSIAIIVKVVIAPGWHIYQYVPSSLPYIVIGHILELPETVRASGSWIEPRPTSYANDPGVLVYENEAVFIQKAVKSAAAKAGNPIRTGLFYQTCDLRQCLPPDEKMVDLKL